MLGENEHSAFILHNVEHGNQLTSEFDFAPAGAEFVTAFFCSPMCFKRWMHKHIERFGLRCIHMCIYTDAVWLTIGFSSQVLYFMRSGQDWSSHVSSPVKQWPSSSHRLVSVSIRLPTPQDLSQQTKSWLLIELFKDQLDFIEMLCFEVMFTIDYYRWLKVVLIFHRVLGMSWHNTHFSLFLNILAFHELTHKYKHYSLNYSCLVRKFVYTLLAIV